MDTIVRRSVVLDLSLFFVIFVGSIQSFASKEEEVGNPYKFVGSCTSQGEWTSQALYTSEQIKGYLNQLKEDPNCKALNQELLEHLDSSINSIQKLSDERKTAGEA